MKAYKISTRTARKAQPKESKKPNLKFMTEVENEWQLTTTVQDCDAPSRSYNLIAFGLKIILEEADAGRDTAQEFLRAKAEEFIQFAGKLAN